MKSFNNLLAEFKRLQIDKAVNFELMNDIFISHHSTGIEGSTLTIEETQLLITEGITAKGKPLEHHLMVKDHYEALVWVVEQAKKRLPITPALIQQISALVMKNTGGVISSMAGDYDSSKGDWRKSSVSVGTRYFTNYQKVEGEVNNLCEQINAKLASTLTDDEIYTLAFDAYFYLVSIHPFADGNGRVSRLLMNYILAYKTLPLATIYKEDKQEYYAALEASREKDEINLKPIEEFMFAQQAKYFSEEIEKINNQLNLGNIKL